MPKKVIVAMSGGVDSAVSAALLKRAGFNVEGFFLKLYNSSNFKQGEKRAKKVAKVLKIPLRVLDLKKEFKKEIINYFLKEYKEGRTPNPCVVCNKEIKFGLLFEKTLALKAELIATGHYVRFQKGKLLKGRDKNKDQSYFLWQLSRKQLERALFPVGNYTKAEVRALAKKFKLPVFETPESQEVCFIQGTTNEFLSCHIKQKPGEMINIEGKLLGKNQGLAFYTIGQRKGIGLAGGPYWVVRKDLKKNLLVITKNEKDLYQKELTFKNANWLSGKAPKLPLKIQAKIRYRARLASATIYKRNKVVFNQPQRAITPGQSVVFYQGEELLGGGIIC